MSDEEQLTAPCAAPSDAPAGTGHAPTPPPTLPPDDALSPHRGGHPLPSSHPPEVFVPLRRWVLDSATELHAMRSDLREQLAASAPAPGSGGGGLPDSVVLVTSELATNALAHGNPPAQVHLLVDGHAVLVVVSDNDTTHAPFLAQDREPGAGGFGLKIARQLSADVGWWTDASGKHVWATFEDESYA
ncbi:ATP-binding protein [Cellulomonas sp. S1-8]|uniref:ATP-binding protein n=1 Tax=Cellulomonas sp. S1-8 TaxID=2904790 RepID=UPI002243C739|nr:ATP-binding protein [Cellulomonas sp. S1-8]UZN03193.1 ATP-binding protein [Cellulomonas sp. S1-8]